MSINKSRQNKKSSKSKSKLHSNARNTSKSMGVAGLTNTVLSTTVSTSSALKQMNNKKKRIYSNNPSSPIKNKSSIIGDKNLKLHSIQAKRASLENAMISGKIVNSGNNSVTTPLRFETQSLTFDAMRKQRQKDRKISSNTTPKNKKKLKNQMQQKTKGMMKMSSRPTFQFQIGLQVGTSLGECYLQVQKLENSMDKLLTVSEDVSDVLQYLHDNNIGTDDVGYEPQSNLIKNSQEMKRRKHDSNASLPLVDNPLEEVSILNENLIEWQRDSLMRMQAMSSSVRNLQNSLEELDKHHVQAQNLLQMNNNRDIDEAYRTIAELQNEVYKTKMILQDKTLEIQRLKITKQRRKSNLESVQEQQARELELDRKESELDKDAELIAAQSEELRKESNRLLTEREEVRKQKEKWTAMIEEVKQQKSLQDELFNARNQQLISLKQTLAQEQKKLYRKAKKIKAREKRLMQLRNMNQQNYVQTANFMNSSNGGSDYGAESELTYFSDGETVIESVNSISDDESQDMHHKQHMQQANSHLNLPDHHMY